MSITDLIPWKREGRKVPVKQEEARPLDVMSRDMGRLFDEFFKGFGMAPFRAFGEEWNVFSPQLDMVETETEVKVSAELPGLDENDVEVSLSQGLLMISGEKREEREEKGENYYHTERSYGSFRRSVALPCEIKEDEVEATFKNGVLTVTLPKTTTGQPCKKVTVKSG